MGDVVVALSPERPRLGTAVYVLREDASATPVPPVRITALSSPPDQQQLYTSRALASERPVKSAAAARTEMPRPQVSLDRPDPSSLDKALREAAGLTLRPVMSASGAAAPWATLSDEEVLAKLRSSSNSSMMSLLTLESKLGNDRVRAHALYQKHGRSPTAMERKRALRQQQEQHLNSETLGRNSNQARFPFFVKVD
jgi:hypothetical protein